MINNSNNKKKQQQQQQTHQTHASAVRRSARLSRPPK